MSVPLTARSGGNKLFSKHSGASTADEAEYDRLRNLAHAAHRKRNDCFDRSRTAYQSGQKALAHQLSVEGKEHDRAGVEYHKQARDFIFRVNNTQRAEDEIDLHGLYVQEAKDVLSRRIQAEKARHSTGLHVIVGKGNHSDGGIQKIKPAVIELCNELNLQYTVEQNEGRLYISFTANQGEKVSSGIWGWISRAASAAVAWLRGN